MISRKPFTISGSGVTFTFTPTIDIRVVHNSYYGSLLARGLEPEITRSIYQDGIAVWIKAGGDGVMDQGATYDHTSIPLPEDACQ